MAAVYRFKLRFPFAAFTADHRAKITVIACMGSRHSALDILCRGLLSFEIICCTTVSMPGMDEKSFKV